MCTYIIQKADLYGSAKGANGWFPLTLANVCFDHPAHANLEHALLIDFVNPQEGRVAVELSASSARALIKAIEAALEEGREVGADKEEHPAALVVSSSTSSSAPA